MLIIGCDFHPKFQQIAFTDTETLSYMGLQPGRRNSAQSEPQMHISKEGDPYLRTLLVRVNFRPCYEHDNQRLA